MQVLTHCAVSPPWWVPLFVLCNIHITILLSWVAAGPVSIPFILSRVVFLARCAVTSTVFCLYAVSVLGMENILAVSYYNNGKHLIWTWMLIETLEPSRLGLGTRDSDMDLLYFLYLTWGNMTIVPSAWLETWSPIHNYPSSNPIRQRIYQHYIQGKREPCQVSFCSRCESRSSNT